MLRYCSIPMVGGTNPLNLFCDRYNLVSAVRLQMEEGIAPLNRLAPKLKTSILGNFSPISTGMWPCRLFPPTSKSVSVDRLYRDSGISPESPLFSRLRNCRLLRLPRLAGIGPCSQFSLRDIARSDDRLPRDSGTGPVKVLFISESCRRCVRVLPM
ncbi:hypothetical protein U9M48_037021 [Paspalum notatum var. saurae]|uniref:Uncharacterized protein n=1 Tax=Paspalum notatum var. saurae TaxID=547442 RepID=A0AAQ3X9I5_PASNO